METNEKSSHGSLNTNTSVEEEGRLVRLLNWYRQIPVIGKIPVRVLMGLLVAALAILLAVLFPQGDCTCEDQFDDPKLQTMAKAGDQQVKQYLAQKDNTINCAGRRKELLEHLKQKKTKAQLKR